jgi:hypothetical protein
MEQRKSSQFVTKKLTAPLQNLGVQNTDPRKAGSRFSSWAKPHDSTPSSSSGKLADIDYLLGESDLLLASGGDIQG